MSVAPAWRQLPLHLVPRRLKGLRPAAVGKNSLAIYRKGDGPFVQGPFADGLRLYPDPSKSNHGVVEPVRVMPLQEYQAALAATRSDWSIDEA
jgi:hypothetical protein